MSSSARSQHSDAQLVAAARAGDFESFAELHRRFSPALYRRMSRLLGNGADVDDVIQEIFLQLHMCLDRYDSSRPFKNWLDRIARNVAYSHLRRRTPQVDDSALLELQRGPDQWRKLSARDRLRVLDSLLAGMSADAREAFVMFAVEGLSLAEIAEICDEPLHTIAARVRRARERLLQAMRIREPDEISAEFEP